ncbi:MAG: hypothetical protein ACOX5T_05175 [Candidatus Cryptobacteroides sp.]|jgi:hypothetical protein
MGTVTKKIQTGIRMDKSLYEQLKRKARSEGRSLNNYVVSILRSIAEEDKFANLVIPDELPEDLKQLGKSFKPIVKERLENDERLRYILSI